MDGSPFLFTMSYTVPYAFRQILDLGYDEHLVLHNSRHYLAYIGSQECVMSKLRLTRQRSRTTVHHIGASAYAKRSPDFITVPLEEIHHVSGSESLNSLSEEGFRVKWDMPLWEELSLIYLRTYIMYRDHKGRGIFETPMLGREASWIEPCEGLYDSAVHWAQQLIKDVELMRAT